MKRDHTTPFLWALGWLVVFMALTSAAVGAGMAAQRFGAVSLARASMMAVLPKGLI